MRLFITPIFRHVSRRKHLCLKNQSSFSSASTKFAAVTPNNQRQNFEPLQNFSIKGPSFSRSFSSSFSLFDDNGRDTSLAALEFAHTLPPSKLGTSHPNLDSFLAAVRDAPSHMNDEDKIDKQEELSTLIILTNTQKRTILLGKKLRGFGTGKYNGFGGRLESASIDPSPAHGAQRELMEEANISIPLEIFESGSVGVLTFSFQDRKQFSMVVHLFHVDVQLKGEEDMIYVDSNNGEQSCDNTKGSGFVIDPKCIQKCDEMIPEWFEWSNVPLHKMFADDSVWLTHFLSSLDMGDSKRKKNQDSPMQLNGWFHFGPGGDDSNQILHYFLDV